MMRLEDISVGLDISGITQNGPVTVERVVSFGFDALQVTYRDPSGSLKETLLFRENEQSLAPVEANRRSFTANADELKLASEALRIRLAYLFDPYLAVRASVIEPLPHQITAVYQEMLPKLPLRYVLADDPGAGKTVMAGLLIKEMMARGDLKRCLVVCPGSLCEQWQDELYEKFGLAFTILENSVFESAVTRNAFNEHDLCIARLDKLSRDERIQGKLKKSSWDLVVCDEAHKMSASYSGGEVKRTKRYQLGQLLGDITENLLLMTATPHNGKPDDFQLFMALIDPDRFGVRHGSSAAVSDVSDVMRRLVKEELLKFDGRPLFPERRAYTVSYELSEAEKALYDNVTAYVSEEFNRADRLDGKRRNSVGFALTSLQRRLASSPEAIYQSLRRRRRRLENQLDTIRRGSRVENTLVMGGSFYPVSSQDDDFDVDDLNGDEYERYEDSVVDSASAAATITELEAEIETLTRLEGMAKRLRESGYDRKWEELSLLLQDDARMFDGDGTGEKLIIFTEHKDTLFYLQEKISVLLGNPDAVVVIRGGMSRDDRRAAQHRFTQDKDVRVLIATDAAGEGINLQRAHLMINYDLPWNPNRLEQRFGRIHRIGQTEVCHLWNLVATDTREGQVFERLFSKLNEERDALGGKVFDVLGKVSFGEKTLRDLLLEAVRYGDDPKVRARLNEVVDNALDIGAVKRLIADYALTDDLLRASDVVAVKEDMERAEMRKLEPHFVGGFFIEALKRSGGRVARREKGRYEVKRVPSAVIAEADRLGEGAVSRTYERITFDRACVNMPGAPVAELIAPGHPLLKALCSLALREWGSALQEGSILIDEQDWGEEPRVLFYIESSIEDDVVDAHGDAHVVSKSLRFVELDESGEARSAGFAPYLDYASPSAEQLERLRSILQGCSWLQDGAEERVLGFAMTSIVREELDAVRARREERIDKVSKAVDERLTAEVRYWDGRAAELRVKEAKGKTNSRINSSNAVARANDLSERREKRLTHLEAERALRPQPPRIVGRAVVVPQGLMRKLSGGSITPSQRDERATIEAAGMRAVMNIERELGYVPRDVSRENCGYDIESRVPSERDAERRLRFIEVKARSAGADTITVSCNELRCAGNAENIDSFILAIVEVGEAAIKTTYIAHPFAGQPHTALASSTFYIDKLIADGDVILSREEAR